MQRFSIRSRLMRRWMLLVAVLAVVIAGFSVYRLNAIFGSQDVTSIDTLNAVTYCLDKSG